MTGSLFPHNLVISETLIAAKSRITARLRVNPFRRLVTLNASAVKRRASVHGVVSSVTATGKPCALTQPGFGIRFIRLNALGTSKLRLNACLLILGSLTSALQLFEPCVFRSGHIGPAFTLNNRKDRFSVLAGILFPHFRGSKFYLDSGHDFLDVGHCFTFGE